LIEVFLRLRTALDEQPRLVELRGKLLVDKLGVALLQVA
jgi:hypothetical protein